MKSRAILLLALMCAGTSPASLPAENNTASVLHFAPDRSRARIAVLSWDTEGGPRSATSLLRAQPGMAVADVGAGTGLFTRLFAKEVGADGKVYAVDISKKFIKHIEKTCKEQDIKNVTGIVCTADSSKLPAHSIDLAFICDVYHHFEFPFKTMSSIHQALRPGGQVFVVDFKRIEGQTPMWRLIHVRAGQEQVTKEITSCGFKLIESPEILKDNYCMIFEKVDKPEK